MTEACSEVGCTTKQGGISCSHLLTKVLVAEALTCMAVHVHVRTCVCVCGGGGGYRNIHGG